MEIPAPLVVPVGGALRFAVGSERGYRANTWTVAGGTSGHDIYVSQRASMHGYKLSLHASGDWRMAFTTTYAEQNAIDTKSRVVHRFEPSDDVAPGVKLAAAVVVPATSMTPPFSETRSKGGPVSWWPAPEPGHALRFNILLLTPAVDSQLAVDCVGEVGRIGLPAGYAVWVLVDLEPTEPSGEVEWESQRHQVFGRTTTGFTPGGSVRYKSGASLGYNDQGVPILVDLGGGVAAETEPPNALSVFKLDGSGDAKRIT